MRIAPYSSALTAAGGIPPYTFSNTGILPGGLTLNTSTGAVTGTPTTAGVFSFMAKVVDSSGLATGTLDQAEAALELVDVLRRVLA